MANAIKILVIADHLAELETLQWTLEPLLNEIFLASSLEQGLGWLETCQPDMVILSLNGPVENILEACRKLRAASPARIMVLAIFDKPALVARALDSGADEYLVKPFTGGMLVAQVNKLARRCGRTNRLIMSGVSAPDAFI